MTLLDLPTSKLGGTEVYLARTTAALKAVGWSHLIVLTDAASHVREFLERAGATVVTPLVGERSPAALFARLRPVIRQYRPRVAVTHFVSATGPLPAMLRALGVPKIVWVDDHSGAIPESDGGPAEPPDALTLRGAARAARLKTCFAVMDRIVGVSEHVVERLVTRDSAPLRKVRRVYNGVAPSALRESLGLRGTPGGSVEPAPGHRVLFACGQLHPKKGFGRWLRAIAPLVRARGDLEVWIAGDGPARDELEALGEELLGGKLRLLGLRDDVPELMARPEVVAVVVPSRWREAFGFVSAEAAMAGKPALASRIGGLPEVVLEGLTGYLVHPEAPEGWAAVTAQLLTGGTAEVMGQLALELGERRFHVDRMVAELLQVVAETVPELGIAREQLAAAAPANGDRVSPSARPTDVEVAVEDVPAPNEAEAVQCAA